MKEGAVTIFIVFLGLPIGYYYYASIRGRLILNKLSEYLIYRDFREFDDLAYSRQAEKYIKPFNLDFIKMNRDILGEDKKAADSWLEYFQKVNMNERQKETVYLRMYYYFLTTGTFDKAEECYHQLCSVKYITDRKNLMRTYDTYVKKGFRYLKETEEELLSAPGQNKTALEALLADMYVNAGDEKNAEKYRKTVQEKMKIERKE